MKKNNTKKRNKIFTGFYTIIFYYQKKIYRGDIYLDKPGYKNFLFDGSNFRGYGLESELIAKHIPTIGAQQLLIRFGGRK